ncbi:MAG: hypothetical protein K6T86_02275 [Pirellulales bacterium]|nr:hypothetical protein [Pirellulales bacterium]
MKTCILPDAAERLVGRMVVLAAWLAALCWGAWPVRKAQGQNGYISFSSGNGLQMLVDMSWTDGAGYRPIMVEVTAPGTPAAVDRQFSVRLIGRYRYMPASPAMAVTEHFVIPAGSNQARAVLTVPTYFIWNQLDVELYEDGEYLDRVSQRDVFFGMQSFAWDLGRPRILVATSNSTWGPLPSVLLQGQAGNQSRPPMQPPAGGAVSPRLLLPPGGESEQIIPGLWQSLQSAQAAVVRLESLPERWQQYLSCDLVCISLDDLLLLARSHPRRLEALLGWVHAGGTIAISGLTEGYSRLAELERVLGLPAGRGGVEESRERGWLAADPALLAPLEEVLKAMEAQGMLGPDGKPVTDMGGMGVGSGLPSSAGFSSQPPMVGGTGAFVGGSMSGPADGPRLRLPEGMSDLSWVRRPKPGERPFMHRRYGLGIVVGLAKEGPFSISQFEWQWLSDTLQTRLNWPMRYGLNLQGGNADFWQFLIPGVGLVPRWTFLLLISVFVVVIGPVNYFWLKRQRKLYLLPVLVPSVALLVTLGLFVYSMVADGLGVRVRARSLTEIDQRAGRVTTWSRLSYYAGLAPSGGLTFSDDVALFPIEPEEMPDSGVRRQRELEWADGKQYLRRGWLASRVPTQYLSMRTRTSKAGLRILGPSGKGLRVRNELGANVERLLVCDEGGLVYAGQQLAEGAEAVLAPADLQQEADAFRAAWKRCPLEYPTGIDPNFRGFGPRRYYTGRYGGMALQQGNLLETALFRVQQGCAAGGQELLTEPRTYLAIAAGPAEVELGMDVVPEASLFVIQGRW